MLEDILNKLGLSKENGVTFTSDKDWLEHSNLPKRIKNIIHEKIKPTAFYLFGDEPLILFFDNPESIEKVSKDCWNFNKSPVVFVTKNNQTHIYNGFSFLKQERKLEILTDKDNISDFEYFKLITGVTWKKYQQKLKDKTKVDDKLLEDIKVLRRKLISTNVSSKSANFLIGRIIFIRYLIDRKVVVKYQGNNRPFTNDDLIEILNSKRGTYQFFDYLEKEFNGNLFPVDSDELLQVSLDTLQNIKWFLQGISLNTGQYSLFDIYDFSIIPIELVSHIYEFFIGKSGQEDKGAYYTPLFLVDYIQKDTVSQYFKKNKSSYNCKVLDPACGSGIFLVETLRKIIHQYQDLNQDYEDDIVKYKKALRKLLKDNIFGIDNDENAVNVAIFSLYITLLDYLTPPDISSFKFPELINTNFFVDDFFNDKNMLTKKKFQFIIGNPPWGNLSKEQDSYISYIKKLQKEERLKNLISSKEIAQAFLIKVKDYTFEECAFIVTSKVLYNLNGDAFREYFLNNNSLRKVFELSSVRHYIFDKSNDKAVAPASILFFSKSKKNNTNDLINHISLKPNLFFNVFKLLVIEKYDVKNIPQCLFLKHDWLWKTLVYGNILDFQLIKRLKDEFDSIDEVVSNTDRFIRGQGLKLVDGDKKNESSELIGKPFLTTNKKNISPYFVSTPKELFNYDYVGYLPKKKALFEAPALLITGGTNKEFKSVSGISYSDCVFKSSLTAIKVIDDESISFLKAFMVILNSNFFSYYITSIGSSIGIEREETHDVEKWSTPFGSNTKLVKLATFIEEVEKQIHLKDFEDIEKQELKFHRIALEASIDDELLKVFNFNSQEISLFEYSQEITIPMIKRRETEKIFGRVEYKNILLNKYADVFIKHFNNIYGYENNFFEVEIWYSKFAIAVFFKIIKNPSENTNQIKWLNKSFDDILNKFSVLSFTKETDNLFIQKDIKGFEENSFYVIKPNEYKCWHEAVAHLDLGEFIEEIHKINDIENVKLQ